MEEKTEMNLYGFVYDNPVSSIDVDGLYTYDVIPYYNSPALYFKKKEVELHLGQIQQEVFKPTPCCSSKGKGVMLKSYTLVGYSFIWYKAGVGLDRHPNGPSKMTLKQHELTHARYFEDVLKTLDNFAKGIQNKCVNVPCWNAMFRYYYPALKAYALANEAYNDKVLDCNEYGDCDGKEDLLAQRNQAATKVNNLAETDNRICSRSYNW